MPYLVKGIDRTTGIGSQFTVDVETEQEALAAAAERGFAVEALQHVKKTQPPKQPQQRIAPTQLSEAPPPVASWDVADVFIRVTGLLFIIGAFIWFLTLRGQGYGSSFKEDNAVGATANATEAINLKLGFWLNVFTGLMLYFYSTMRRIRKKIAGV